jgi:mannonate dehydratase
MAASMRIAVATGPEPGTRWTLMKQIGVECAVGGIGLQPVEGGPDDQPWSEASLRKAKATFEQGGIPIEVIESRPPMEKIKLGLDGRDEQIEVCCELVRNMGKVGIPTWCYTWMPILGVIRTSMTLPIRGGARASGFELAKIAEPGRTIRNIDGVALEEQESEGAVRTVEAQWANLRYFLERIVPVAEEAGVKLAMHPDDPPLSPINGVPRIMSTIDDYQKLVDLAPSPVNGICLCQGNFTLMTDDLPSVIRHFGEQKKIHFLHIRDVRGTPEKYSEVFHDDGQTDLVECFRAYRDVGFDGVLRPDHYPAMGDDDYKDELGIARLFAVGYLKGIREAVFGKN